MMRSIILLFLIANCWPPQCLGSLTEDQKAAIVAQIDQLGGILSQDLAEFEQKRAEGHHEWEQIGGDRLEGCLFKLDINEQIGHIQAALTDYFNFEQLIEGASHERRINSEKMAKLWKISSALNVLRLDQKQVGLLKEIMDKERTAHLNAENKQKTATAVGHASASSSSSTGNSGGWKIVEKLYQIRRDVNKSVDDFGMAIWFNAPLSFFVEFRKQIKLDYVKLRDHLEAFVETIGKSGKNVFEQIGKIDDKVRSELEKDWKKLQSEAKKAPLADKENFLALQSAFTGPQLSEVEVSVKIHGLPGQPRDFLAKLVKFRRRLNEAVQNIYPQIEALLPPMSDTEQRKYKLRYHYALLAYATDELYALLVGVLGDKDEEERGQKMATIWLLGHDHMKRILTRLAEGEEDVERAEAIQRINNNLDWMAMHGEPIGRELTNSAHFEESGMERSAIFDAAKRRAISNAANMAALFGRMNALNGGINKTNKIVREQNAVYKEISAKIDMKAKAQIPPNLAVHLHAIYGLWKERIIKIKVAQKSATKLKKEKKGREEEKEAKGRQPLGEGDETDWNEESSQENSEEKEAGGGGKGLTITEKILKWRAEKQMERADAKLKKYEQKQVKYGAKVVEQKPKVENAKKRLEKVGGVKMDADVSNSNADAESHTNTIIFASPESSGRGGGGGTDGRGGGGGGRGDLNDIPE